MIRDYFSLAIKSIRHRGIRSWLTMLGIFIGIAAVVALISLGQGLQQAITGQFASISTDTLIVQSAETGFGPPGSTAVKKLNEHDLELIKNVDGVEFAIPRLLRVVKVEYNKIAKFKFLGSIPKQQEEIDFIFKTFNLKTELGRLISSDDRGKIVLGSDFADSDFEKDIRVGTTINVQGKEFEVIGILKKTSTIQFNSAFLMPEEDMKEILIIGDEIDIIAVKVVDKNNAEETAEKITEKLRKDRDQEKGEEDFSVQTPSQTIESVNTIFNIINLIVSGIASISLLIGGIGIANVMYTSVLERTKDIGIMKAIGAKNSSILSIFLIESALLGLVGGLIGAIIGLFLAFSVSFIANSAFGQNILQVSLSIPLLLAAISFSFFIGMLSGILPALQASKLNPVEALRK